MFDPVETPMLAYAYELALWGQQSRQIVILSGLGIDPSRTAAVAINPAAAPMILQQITVARAATYKVWRGLDIRHIARQAHGDYRQFDVMIALDPATPPLNQAAWDFLTLRDNPQARLECYIAAESAAPSVAEWAGIPDDELRLMLAFRRQLVEEAAPHRHNVAAGAYVLLREPLARLDALIDYDSLRLLITPAGIGAALIRGNDYVPFWWSPDGDTNTSQVWVSARVRFALDILLAAIWRDACVTEQAFAERRDAGRGYQARGDAPQHDNPLRLPRRVYKSQWGSPADREAITSNTKSAHAVRGFYRSLADGHHASEAARDNAQLNGFPLPPEGFTFVSPHTRGAGEPAQARRVICRGLQTAKILLD